MILKVGRVPERNGEADYGSAVWQFTENVTRFNFSQNSCGKDERASMNLTYYIGGSDLCHATGLEKEDTCFLMNDEGKTIERIR